MLCQKESQEDGWGGEGATEVNIGGVVGSIPPYPTFIPPGNKDPEYATNLWNQPKLDQDLDIYFRRNFRLTFEWDPRLSPNFLLIPRNFQVSTSSLTLIVFPVLSWPASQHGQINTNISKPKRNTNMYRKCDKVLPISPKLQLMKVRDTYKNPA